MDVAFATKELKDTCEQAKIALKTLGKPCAKKLQLRLMQLVAAANVSELIAGRPHPLKGDRLGQFALDLHGGKRLVFEPNHADVTKKDDGSVDWASVTKVKIVFIGDYHG